MIIILQIPLMKKELSIYQDDLRDIFLDDNFLSDHISEYQTVNLKLDIIHNEDIGSSDRCNEIRLY
jgi:hypothetical protein